MPSTEMVIPILLSSIHQATWNTTMCGAQDMRMKYLAIKIQSSGLSSHPIITSPSLIMKTAWLSTASFIAMLIYSSIPLTMATMKEILANSATAMTGLQSSLLRQHLLLTWPILRLDLINSISTEQMAIEFSSPLRSRTINIFSEKRQCLLTMGKRTVTTSMTIGLMTKSLNCCSHSHS